MSDIDILNNVQRTINHIPGIKYFANYKVVDSENFKTNDASKAIEFNVDGDSDHIKIHLVLLSGFNIKNVLREVQYRIKFELEKASSYAKSYIVDLVVDDIADD